MWEIRLKILNVKLSLFYLLETETCFCACIFRNPFLQEIFHSFNVRPVYFLYIWFALYLLVICWIHVLFPMYLSVFIYTPFSLYACVALCTCLHHHYMNTFMVGWYLTANFKVLSLIHFFNISLIKGLSHMTQFAFKLRFNWFSVIYLHIYKLFKHVFWICT